MAGKYLIGVDNGTQSTKVVIYDLEGNVVCEGKRTLLPMEHPRPGTPCTPTTTSGSPSSRRAARR